MDISKLKQQRTTSRSGFFQALISINKRFEVNASPQTIRSRFEKLNKAWMVVQTRHNNYINNLPEQNEAELEDRWISELCDGLDTIELQVDNYLEGMERAESRIRLQAKDTKLQEEKECQQKQLQLSAGNVYQEMRIKKHQEQKKFDMSVQLINKLLYSSSTAVKHHLTEAVNDSLLSLEACVNSCKDINVKLLSAIKDGEAKQEENQCFFDILEKYNDARYQCKLFGVTHKEVEV